MVGEEAPAANITNSNTSNSNRSAPNNSRNHRKRRRRRYQSSCTHVKVQDLGVGQVGVLITCEPKHEHQCSTEANVLLCEWAERIRPELKSKFDKEIVKHKADVKPGVHIEDDSEEHERSDEKSSIAEQLNSELKEIKKNKNTQSQQVFTRMDIGINGSVFLRISKDLVDMLSPSILVKSILWDAKKSHFANCRHCVRFIPVHSTCKATPEAAAVATRNVLKRLEPEGKTYGIQYRSRNNSSAHRRDYIKAVAEIVDEIYKVDLDNPDWVLIIEVLKTSCCIGIFEPFFELGKLNVRECAYPTTRKKKKKDETQNNTSAAIPALMRNEAPEVKPTIDKQTSPDAHIERKDSAKEEQTHKFESTIFAAEK